MKICIAGGPKTGKTTLSEQLAKDYNLPVVHGDDFMSMGWSESSAHLAKLIMEAETGIFEGVQIARALRKALEASPAAPCRSLIILRRPLQELTKGQASMTKGCETVMAEILPELKRRGVEILYQEVRG